MENKKDILSKEYVLNHGINFDEELWFTSYGDEVLDNPEDEGGIIWNDSTIGIEWPDVGNVILSEKDKNLPSLVEAKIEL